MGESAHELLSLSVGHETETALLAKRLAAVLAVGDVVLLEGTLGAGKTAFCRAVIRAVLNEPEAIVASPTFTFSQIYTGETLTITHFDLYRMGEPEEVYDLGWDDALAEGATLVEWPDRLDSLQPVHGLRVLIEPDADLETGRHIRLFGDEGWAKRLETLTQ
ncbi:MAG: tRNA (adenosine(37)-N6)-threonylcarbamoyltransferase complex ATPase subunit type 1 TsaE [Alphaproteobacteria bacterium]